MPCQKFYGTCILGPSPLYTYFKVLLSSRQCFLVTIRDHNKNYHPLIRFCFFNRKMKFESGAQARPREFHNLGSTIILIPYLGMWRDTYSTLTSVHILTWRPVRAKTTCWHNMPKCFLNDGEDVGERDREDNMDAQLKIVTATVCRESQPSGTFAAAKYAKCINLLRLCTGVECAKTCQKKVLLHKTAGIS